MFGAWKNIHQAVRVHLPVMVVLVGPPQIKDMVLLMGMMYELPVLVLGPVRILLPCPDETLVHQSRALDEEVCKWICMQTPRGMAPLLRHGLCFFKRCHRFSLLIARLNIGMRLLEVVSKMVLTLR